ncbi:hypothetical protein JKP88DRAFT_255889 [Tribonema minus]|uniref:CCHC-type domain-containing protein n=1 Tax=Tribonema minus TaxID=303371 RepID=A0A835YXG8_9STRA|nr:hypothetical protein JKP88DRAFT_255889 [Tribonema minus]
MSSSEPEQDESYSVVNARFFLVVSNSIDPRAMGPTRIVMQFTDSQDGRGAFKALESAHKPNTTFNKLQLHAKLADAVRENNEDITAYSLRLVNLRDELRIKEGNKQVWPDMQFGGAAEGTTRRQHLRHDNRDHQHYRGHHPRASDAAAATAFKGTCYNCGATGHKSRDCSRRKGGATRHGSNDGQHSRQAHRQANGGNRSDGKNRGDPKQQAGAGSNGKYCPVHPMAKHDAGECKGLRTSCTTGIIPGCFLQNPGCPTKNSALVLKQHPHLATALAAVATNQEAKSAAAGEQDLPIIRPFGLVTTAPAAVELKPAALAAAADDMPIDMVLDSGAPHHYFDPFELNWSFGVALTDIKPYNHKVNTGGGSRSAVCMGTVHLRLTAADGSLVPLAIANSINVPLLGHHLLSVNANLKAATAAAAAAAGPSHPGYDGDDFDVVSMLEADSDDDEIIPSSATAPTPLAAAAHPGIDAAVGAVTTDPAAGDGDTARNGGSAAATGAVMAARTAPSIPRWKQPKQPSTHAMGTRTRATSQPPPAVNPHDSAVPVLEVALVFADTATLEPAAWADLVLHAATLFSATSALVMFSVFLAQYHVNMFSMPIRLSQSDVEKVALTLKSPAINAPQQRRRRSAAAAPSASNGRVAQLRGQTVTTPPMETPLIPPWSSLAESSGDSFHPEARCNRSSGDASVGAAATTASSERIVAPEARDPTSEEEELGHPCCNWNHVKAVQAEINTLFQFKRQECLEACAKMGLSESAVKTGLLNHHFFMERSSFVSFESKHAHDLCTDELGGVMPFTLTRDKTFLFVRERWFMAFLAIDRKVEVNGVVPPEYSTILYQLHDLLKKHTLVNQLTRTRWISHDTVNLDIDSGDSGSGNAKAAVKLRDTQFELPALHFKRLLVQLAKAGFTEEQADAASALWSWSSTINQDTFVLDGSWYTLKGSDLTRIAGTEWLNDVIMDAFLDLRVRQVQHVHAVLSTIYRDNDPAAMSVVEPMRQNAKKQQTNGSDCGVFVCANAWCHLNNRPFFTQEDAQFFRWQDIVKAVHHSDVKVLDKRFRVMRIIAHAHHNFVMYPLKPTCKYDWPAKASPLAHAVLTDSFLVYDRLLEYTYRIYSTEYMPVLIALIQKGLDSSAGPGSQRTRLHTKIVGT